MRIWYRGARQLKAMGWKQAAIAELFGVTEAAVSRALHREPIARSRETVMAALSRAHQTIIAKGYARRVMVVQLKLDGKTNRAIARDLGVTPERVRLILKRARSEGMLPVPEVCA